MAATTRGLISGPCSAAEHAARRLPSHPASRGTERSSALGRRRPRPRDRPPQRHPYHPSFTLAFFAFCAALLAASAAGTLGARPRASALSASAVTASEPSSRTSPSSSSSSSSSTETRSRLAASSSSASSPKRLEEISSLTLYSPFYISDNESGKNRTWSALNSWKRLLPQSNIIMFTEDDSSCSWLRRNGFAGVRCLLECTHSAIPRQDIGCMAATAARLASTPFLCMINSDIMLLPHFRQHFRRVFLRSDIAEPFMVGQRTNVLQNMRTDFSSPAWESQVLREATSRGELDGVCAIDYFVHTQNVWKHISMPGFVTGVWLWDRYLLSEANRNKQITTVDATRAFTAVHLQTEQYMAHEARPFQQYNAEVLRRQNAVGLNDEGTTTNVSKKTIFDPFFLSVSSYPRRAIDRIVKDAAFMDHASWISRKGSGAPAAMTSTTATAAAAEASP